MSGTGSTLSHFSEGNVLPNNITSATSGGELLNSMKAGALPPALCGGKKHKRSKSTKRRKNKKSKSAKRKTNKRKTMKRKTHKR